jgi:hypothetical protein
MMMVMMLMMTTVDVVIARAGVQRWRSVLVILRIGSTHVHTHAAYDVTLAAQALGDVGLDKRHKSECSKRLEKQRRENVEDKEAKNKERKLYFTLGM